MFRRVLTTLIVMYLISPITAFASPTGTAKIGNFVWVDKNANGIQNTGEPGVAGVTVKLLTSSGAVVATTTTNSSGAYSFTISISSPGMYKVQFGTPGQYTWTLEEVAGGTVENNSNADADGISNEFQISPGDDNPCLDAGILQSSAGTATVGDFVFVDKDADGKQDSGEPGVAGVVVKLLNSTGATVATATTNSSGKYFLNVSISACGTYKVQFGTPGQFTWTTNQAAGTTATNNSNADSNGLSGAFQLCPGDYNMCLDAGILQSPTGTACIGDFVWDDVNENGRQDSGEPGVPNVMVRLRNSAGTVVATTTTNAQGRYLFVNFPISSCGQYRVQFGNPGQYIWTTKEAANANAVNNNNADANGYTDFFTVCPGDYNTCIDGGILDEGGPLPVRLTEFRGNYSGGVTKLQWTTTLETGRTSYEIERSNDGVTFTRLATVNGSGRQSGGSYNFNDNVPLSGTNYYRLKINEDNAAPVYSNTVVVNAVAKGISINLISANPFINQVSVNVTIEEAATVRVALVNQLGSVVRTQQIQGRKGSNQISITDLSSLPQGIYNLEVATGGQSKVIKLMKN
jgi:5-hydroxyisourate hydrolase-like protein (transthyretin family)